MVVQQDILTKIRSQIEPSQERDGLGLETDLSKLVDSFGLFDLILEIEEEFDVQVDLESIDLSKGLTPASIFNAIKTGN